MGDIDVLPVLVSTLFSSTFGILQSSTEGTNVLLETKAMELKYEGGPKPDIRLLRSNLVFLRISSTEFRNIICYLVFLHSFKRLGHLYYVLGVWRGTFILAFHYLFYEVTSTSCSLPSS